MFSAISTGLVISIARISEPYFLFLIKKEVKSWFGILMTEKEIDVSKGYEKDSLSAFLASSLNVELVNVILYSICDHSSGRLSESSKTKGFSR